MHMQVDNFFVYFVGGSAPDIDDSRMSESPIAELESQKTTVLVRIFLLSSLVPRFF